MQLLLEDSVLYIPVSTCLLVCFFFIVVCGVLNLGCLSCFHKTTLNGTWAMGIQTVIMVLLLTCYADSGLLRLLSLFSLTIAFLVWKSARSFFGVFVLAFTVLSMLSTPLLSFSTTVRVSPPSQSSKQRNICSLYNGQNIQLKVGINDFQWICPWSMYIFHSDFSLMNDISSPQLTSPSVGDVSAHGRSRLREVISVGERTRIAGFEEVQTLVLVGEGSSIENSILQCTFDASKQKNTTYVVPCLVGTPQLRATNLTMEFYIKVNDVMNVRSLHVSKTESCFELVQQYNTLREELRENSLAIDLPPQLIRCREPDIDVNAFLKRIAVSPDFYAAMPLLVALRTRLPQIFAMLQTYGIYFFEHAGIPVGKAILEISSMLEKIWRQLAVWTITLGKVSLPYLFTAFLSLKCTAEGFVYGISAYKCEDGSHDWGNSAIDLGFFVGANLREGLGVVFSSVLDALTVVPGLWAVVHWSFIAEWAITKALICGFGQGLYRTATEVLRPVAQSMWRLLRFLCTSLGPLLGILRAQVCCTYIVTLIKDACCFLFKQELYVMNLELCLINLFMKNAVWILIFVIRSSGRVLAKSCCYGMLTVKWYNTTSFFIHFSIFFLQTFILFVALQNEIRDLVEYQFAKGNGKSAKGTDRTIETNGSSMWLLAKIFQKLQTYPKLNVVNGIVLLARSHYQVFTAYIVQHSVLWILLVGLSVLPFTSKLYAFTLHVVLPWQSSKLFLKFFASKPSHSQVTMMFGVRLVLALLLECTIGDFISRLLKEISFLLTCSVCILLGMWVWKHHRSMFRQFLISSEKISSDDPGNVDATAA